MAGESVAWTRPFDVLLRAATAEFPLLSSCTPSNAAEEHARLVERWSAGDELSPKWTPPVVDRARLDATRAAIARGRVLVERPERSMVDGDARWLALYRERLDECGLELAMVASAFTPELGALATRRYADGWETQAERENRDFDEAADRLAAEWTSRALDDQPGEGDTIATGDTRDPRSLVSSMRVALARAGVGVRVLVRDRVGALAATGDGVVIVARGFAITPRETARVVLHEVEGHVLPRERARGATPGLLSIGSAHASEDEEGRALVLEERHDVLDARRRISLARRHLTARRVQAGATFVEAVRSLARDGASIEESLRIVTRVMRGAHVRGADVASGLARERVYLASYLRVSDALARGITTLDALGSARLSVAARALFEHDAPADRT